MENTQDLQAKCINKLVFQIIDKLDDKLIKNKIAYFLLKRDKNVEEYMKNISVFYKIIDMSITENNYKRALRYTCLLDNHVKKLIALVINKK